MYIYLFICCCCFKGLGLVVPDMNRITGSNLQCHEVCFAQRSRAIGYTAHQRHRPHVNSDMEHVIQERKPHALRLAFIHPNTHAPVRTRERQQSAMGVAIRLSLEGSWYFFRILQNLRRTWSCRDSSLMSYINVFKVFKANLPKFRFSSDVLAQNIFVKLVLIIITVKNPMLL